MASTDKSKGTDADFGKKSAYMHKIEKAPFWGVRKHIRVSSIDSGVNTNANGQALDADGKVIEGLYCVGNVGGVFYGGADTYIILGGRKLCHMLMKYWRK